MLMWAIKEALLCMTERRPRGDVDIRRRSDTRFSVGETDTAFAHLEARVCILDRGMLLDLPELAGVGRLAWRFVQFKLFTAGARLGRIYRISDAHGRIAVSAVSQAST
jgi:hypothetical protein